MVARQLRQLGCDTLPSSRVNGFSAKAPFGGWLTAQNAATFDRIGLTLQYRWFDP
jgi:hypothetical protein